MLVDNSDVPCKKEAALLTGTLKSMIVKEDGQDTDEAYKIRKVSGNTLTKVVAFLENYVEEEMEMLTTNLFEKSKLRQCVGSDRYVQFADIDHKDMFEFIKAATYLDIPPLLDLECVAPTMNIVDKSPSEINSTFAKVNASLSTSAPAVETA